MTEVEKRIEVLNRRLDNVDSVVTALLERVMKQPVRLDVICPKCGANVQITSTSNVKFDSSHNSSVV